MTLIEKKYYSPNGTLLLKCDIFVQKPSDNDENITFWYRGEPIREFLQCVLRQKKSRHMSNFVKGNNKITWKHLSHGLKFKNAHWTSSTIFVKRSGVQRLIFLSSLPDVAMGFQNWMFGILQSELEFEFSILPDPNLDFFLFKFPMLIAK